MQLSHCLQKPIDFTRSATTTIDDALKDFPVTTSEMQKAVSYWANTWMPFHEAQTILTTCAKEVEAVREHLWTVLLREKQKEVTDNEWKLCRKFSRFLFNHREGVATLGKILACSIPIFFISITFSHEQEGCGVISHH